MKTEDGSTQRQAVAEEEIAFSKINDLPIEPLTHVASFLPLPTRALYALSLAAAQCSDEDMSNAFSRKIIASEEGCETTLDFGSMEKDQAVKLKDEDINAILRCIDAVNKVKILRLTNCINISGVGLESLRGSEIIEKIDLTLVGDHEVQRLHPKPPISLEHVVPILDSIIASRGSSLKHLQFPQHWRKDSSYDDSDPFKQFLDRFNESLGQNSNGWNRCVKCTSMEDEPQVEMYDNDSQDYGVQYRTCSVCSKHRCERCCGPRYMYFCAKCERAYCSDCSESEQYVCRRCDRAYCVQCRTDVECSDLECDVELCGHCRCTCLRCQKPYCHDCIADIPSTSYGICNSGHCYGCYNAVADEQVSYDIQNNDEDLSVVTSQETTTQPDDTAGMQQPQMMDGAMASGSVLEYFSTNTSATTLQPNPSNTSAVSSSSNSSSTVASAVPHAQANSEAATSLSSSQQTRRSKRKMSQQGGKESKDTYE